MTDTLLNQQMSEAEKQIDERLKEAENIKKLLLDNNTDAALVVFKIILFAAFSVFIYKYGRRLVNYLEQVESLLQGVDLFWIVPVLVTGFAVCFLLKCVRELLLLGRLQGIKRAISSIDGLSEYLENQKQQFDTLRAKFIKAMSEKDGMTFSPPVDVTKELERLRKLAQKANRTALDRTVWLLCVTLCVVTVIIIVAYLSFGYDGSFTVLQKDAVEDIEEAVSIYGKHAVVMTRGGVKYPLIQEEGFTSLVDDLDDNEFMMGKVRADLNLRKSHTTSSEVLDVMRPDSNFFILGEKNGWYFGWYYEGKVYGWASGRFISPKKSDSEKLGTMWREQEPIGSMD